MRFQHTKKLMLTACLISSFTQIGYATEADGPALFEKKGCLTCHHLPGTTNAPPMMGPSLNGLNKKHRILDGSMRNSEKNMRKWLKNPRAVKSTTLMPNLGLTDTEITTFIQYFKTLN